jgi:hypothetical protein
MGDTFERHVKKLGSLNERQCHFLREEVDGLVFGGCSFRIPNTEGMLCHHMIALAKSSSIREKMMVNAMPLWWHTNHWRKQYPSRSDVRVGFDVEMLPGISRGFGKQGDEVLPTMCCSKEGWPSKKQQTNPQPT